MIHEPRGVVALLVPWNDPIAIACGQIAAALVTGNAVVYKPSEKTPLAGARLVELLDLGEVLQLVQGDARAGRPLAAHPRVDLVLHTGTVADRPRGARRLRRPVRQGAAASWAARTRCLSMRASTRSGRPSRPRSGAFANAGQVATSVERIYVHRDVAEPFVDALARRAEAIEVGDPRDPGTEMGPLIDEDQRDWVHNQVEDAVHNGAELRAGGRVPEARAASTRRPCSSAPPATRR